MKKKRRRKRKRKKKRRKRMMKTKKEEEKKDDTPLGKGGSTGSQHGDVKLEEDKKDGKPLGKGEPKMEVEAPLEKGDSKMEAPLKKGKLMIDYHNTLEIRDQISEANIQAVTDLLEKGYEICVCTWCSHKRAAKVRHHLEQMPRWSRIQL